MRLSKTSTKVNIFANFIGHGCRSITLLASIPFYIKFLGMEAYGLIAIFTILQTWVALLDVGMRPILGRETALFTGGSRNAQSLLDLLRSIEILAIILAITTAIFFGILSDWITTSWVNPGQISHETVKYSIIIMGVVAATSLIENLYNSAIAGLQRQVLLNSWLVFISTARTIGAIAILNWITPSIIAFFIWQAIVSLLSVIVLACFTYKSLPHPALPPKFSFLSLKNVYAFGIGMAAINILGFLLMQTDKIFLSRMLSLDNFGYYALASLVASGLNQLVSPICAALYPRFTELVASNNTNDLKLAFHKGAQFVSILICPTAFMLIFFSQRILTLWTNDPLVSSEAAPLVSLLAIGTLFNGLMWVPHQLQIAHGWTSLSIKTNIVAVSILIPLLFIVAPQYGTIGVACIWIILNVGYIFIGVHFMFRRILQQEKWKWYFKDIALPFISALSLAIILKKTIPTADSRPLELLVLLSMGCMILIFSSFSADHIRPKILHLIKLN